MLRRSPPSLLIAAALGASTVGLRSPAVRTPFRSTTPLSIISDKYIPRTFPLKATTGLAGISVEPLWKPKLLAAATELQSFMKKSDIPPESTYYNITLTLTKRIYKGIEACGDDWMTLERTYFWGWPVEYVLQITWRELDTAQKWNEWRFWELDPEQVKKVAREDQGVGKPGAGYMTPWEQVAREDYDKRKKALTQEEMAELKRMDTEKMSRETALYKERKERIRDDLDKARGDMLKTFLNKRIKIEHDLRRMQPGSVFNGKTPDDVISELKGTRHLDAGKILPGKSRGPVG